MVALPYITIAFYSELHKFFRPFTNWTLMISTATLIFSNLAGTDYHNGFCVNCINCNEPRIINLKILFHVLYTLSIMCNFVVMSVYWTMLHKNLMQDEGKVFGRAVHLVLVHSIPGITCFINTYITNARLKMSFWKIIPTVGALYGTNAYFNQKKYGDV